MRLGGKETTVVCEDRQKVFQGSSSDQLCPTKVKNQGLTIEFLNLKVIVDPGKCNFSEVMGEGTK